MIIADENIRILPTSSASFFYFFNNLAIFSIVLLVTILWELLSIYRVLLTLIMSSFVLILNDLISWLHQFFLNLFVRTRIFLLSEPKSNSSFARTNYFSNTVPWFVIFFKFLLPPSSICFLLQLHAWVSEHLFLLERLHQYYFCLFRLYFNFLNLQWREKKK